MECKHSCPWRVLTRELAERVASFVPPNEVACNLRAADKLTKEQLKAWTKVRLSQPVPHDAFVLRWGPEDSTHGLTFKKRELLLCLTAQSGSIANLEVAVKAAGCLTEPVVGAAAGAGHLHVCVWLRDRGCPLRWAARSAAAAGHAAVVRWALQEISDPDNRQELAEDCFRAAAGSGDKALCEELLELLDGDGESCADSVRCAAKEGHVDLTFWLLDRVSQPDDDFWCRTAISAAYGFDLPALQRLYQSFLASSPEAPEELFGSQHVTAAALLSPTPDWRVKVEWLETLGGTIDIEGSVHNCSTGYIIHGVFHEYLCKRTDALERIAYLRQRGVLESELFAKDAIACVNLPVLQYLLRSGADTMGELDDDEDLTEEAASTGNVAILSELLAAGCRIGAGTVREAANCGHLHVLQWLLESAHPEAVRAAAAEAFQEAIEEEGTELLQGAAECGSLELVQWLRGRGCPWDERAFWVAAESGNAALLEWMVAEGCPVGQSGLPYLKAGGNGGGDFTTLRCLRRLGCPYDPTGRTFTETVKICSLAVLRWLVVEGCCPVDWEAAREAVDWRIANSFPEAETVLEWIKSHLPGKSDLHG